MALLIRTGGHRGGRPTRRRIRIAIACAVAGVLALLYLTIGAAAAPTCTKSWDRGAGTDNWNDAANWTGDSVPGGSDHVCLTNNATGAAVVYSSGTTQVA